MTAIKLDPEAFTNNTQRLEKGGAVGTKVWGRGAIDHVGIERV